MKKLQRDIIDYTRTLGNKEYELKLWGELAKLNAHVQIFLDDYDKNKMVEAPCLKQWRKQFEQLKIK